MVKFLCNRSHAGKIYLGPKSQLLSHISGPDEVNISQTEPEKEGEGEETGEPIPSQDSLKLLPYRTEGLPWAEEGMELVYERELLIDDLPALKELFKKGLDIEIKEDKVGIIHRLVYLFVYDVCVSVCVSVCNYMCVCVCVGLYELTSGDNFVFLTA